MKKTIACIALCVLIPFSGFCKLNFAPQIGINFSGIVVTGNYHNAPLPGIKAGVRAGGILALELNKNFSIQTGLSFVQNGFNYKEFDYSVRLNGVEVPIGFAYKFHSFFAGAGFYFTQFVSAKQIPEDGSLKAKTLKIGSCEDCDIVALDNGFSLYTGIEIGDGAFARVHYNRGLVHLDPGSPAGVMVTDYNFGLTFGYFLFHKNEEHKTTKNTKKS